MKNTIIFLFLLLSGSSYAQFTISGRVLDEAKNGVGDADVYLTDAKNRPVAKTTTSLTGYYTFTNISKGQYQVVVISPDFRLQPTLVNMTGSNVLQDLYLTRRQFTTDEVVVKSIRAPRNSPTTFTVLEKAEIEQKNFGQDFPYLLNMTPSVVLNSDAGGGVGYTDIRIRGVDATRINVTINGIPLNDAESQGTFWVDLPDFASSAQSIQVQRGVGTSTNGSAAFGASINIQGTTYNSFPYAKILNSYGSFNTHRHNIQFGTGIMNKGWSVDGRISRMQSDGYIDRATSDLSSYYLSVGKYAKRYLLKFITFGGEEETYQAWNGVPESVLKTKRTFNELTYENEVDHYTQKHYQLLYNVQLTENFEFNSALHFTHGEGYYEQFKANDDLSSYNLPPVIHGPDTITTSDIVRRRWLNNHFYGAVASLEYDNKKKLNFIIGGGLNQYDGNHYGEVIWARYASTSNIGDRYYDNDATKKDANVYAKAGYKLLPRLSGYLDLQTRMISYSFLGYNNQLENVTQEVSYNFFNPKFGFVFHPDPESTRSSYYFSVSQASREPSRDDFTQSSPGSRPRPEKLTDFELGYRMNRNRYSLTVNGYYMHYRDQLALTGQINDVGAFTRVNVDVSYRTGIELAGSVNILKWLQWTGNFTYSANKIVYFKEFVYSWDGGATVEVEHDDKDLALTPNIIGASQFRFLPIKGLNLDVMTKYVGKQYLDNTQDESRSIDAYLLNDVVVAYEMKTKGWFKTVTTGVQLNNVLNEEYESKGYTYGGLIGGSRVDFNYYYPQAGFNWMAQVVLGF